MLAAQSLAWLFVAFIIGLSEAAQTHTVDTRNDGERVVRDNLYIAPRRAHTRSFSYIDSVHVITIKQF